MVKIIFSCSFSYKNLQKEMFFTNYKLLSVVPLIGLLRYLMEINISEVCLEWKNMLMFFSMVILEGFD